MVIFHSYVSLPEGNRFRPLGPSEGPGYGSNNKKNISKLASPGKHYHCHYHHDLHVVVIIIVGVGRCWNQ